MSTGARTLQLLSLLQGQRYWPGAELAARLEVSLRTLRRDVDRLRELGYPVQAQPGVAGGYQLAPGAVLPPLVLDDEEAVALAVALQAATAGPVAGTAEAAVRALSKVAQVMPPRLRRRVDALRAMTVTAPWEGGGPRVDPDVLTTAAQACRDSSRLELAYTPAQGDPSVRTVEPHRLVTLGRRWYLVAYDLSRGDWRSFRVDRVRALRHDGSRFLPRALPGGDAAAFVRRGIDRAPGHDVQALVHAPADVVQARVGTWARAAPVDAGSCRLTMRTERLDWAAFTLAVCAARVQDVQPPELVALLHEWAARLGQQDAPATARAAGRGVRSAGATRRRSGPAS